MIIRKENPLYGIWSVLGFSFIIFIAHIYFLTIYPYDLYADEAQYWSWSKELAWGYYSKPPMLAWLIWASTNICGDGSLCVKIASPILHFLTGLFVYGIGHRLFNRRVGFWSCITYATLPGVTVSSFLISTDPALLFFWAASMYTLIRGLQDWHIKWWILLGVFAGLGMLSKYTMILFFGCAMAYFLISRDNRVYLISIKFWLSAIIAGGVYWKNFEWNKMNGYANYLHTKDNANITNFDLHWDKFLEFFMAQFGVFGPILFATLIAASLFLIAFLCKRDAYKLLFSFILPFFFVISAVSLLSRAHANWAVPIYIAGTVLTVSLLLSRKLFWLRTSLALHILIAALVYHVHTVIDVLNIEQYGSLDPFRRVKAQQLLADRVNEEWQKHDDVMLLTNERKTHAALLYYLRNKETGQPPNIMKWNGDNRIDDHYDLTLDMEQYKGRNFLLITKPGRFTKEIANDFVVAHKSAYITFPLYPDYTMEYDVYYLKNFQGYR